MRKLASTQMIIDIQPIPDADAIEVATVNSWKVVVKKGEFIVGDMVIYCEVDSWIPHSLAPFLSKGEPKEYNGVKGERLRTVRLRGQISQGLIIHLGTVDIHWKNEMKIEGYDLTEILGIQKYEPPIPACLSGVVKGPWPSAIPKTDEERIQNLTNEYRELRTFVYEMTEKLEGSSCTMGLINDEFIVCSRNLNLTETEGNTFWKMARKYDVEARMRTLNLNNVVIQGECIGEGIQGNHYCIKGQEFYVFNVYSITDGQYASPTHRMNIVDNLGLHHVPVLCHAPLDALECLGENNIESVLKYADGKSSINSQKMREGVVFKQLNGQKHFKAVSNAYLLKTGG
jgi:RNA ligase (TIGR02306 family)